jgi:D-alanine-D-alanine ligase
MSAKLRVGVIFGGRSGEHEVSLRSARSVLAALDPQRYAPVQIGISHDGAWFTGEGVLDAFEQGHFRRLQPAALLADPGRRGLFSLETGPQGETLRRLADLDVIFPAVHGTFGEDGTLQGLLEMAGVPYVGAGVLGSALGMDKAVFKDVMRANGIPTLESRLLLRSQIETGLEPAVAACETIAPYPLFVKPANLGSSVGITKCRTRADLVEGLMEAARYDRRVLVERGVNAREIEVSVLGNDHPQASLPGEIVPGGDFYTYAAKYLDTGSQLLIPAPLSAEMTEQARRLAVAAYRAIDCAGLARVDFLLDRDHGGLYLNEVNTMPGFTSISMYPKLWEASGLPYPQLVDRLIELALERSADNQRTLRRYDGVQPQ